MIKLHYKDAFLSSIRLFSLIPVPFNLYWLSSYLLDRNPSDLTFTYLGTSYAQFIAIAAFILFLF